MADEDQNDYSSAIRRRESNMRQVHSSLFKKLITSTQYFIYASDSPIGTNSMRIDQPKRRCSSSA
jgi:hypothetical protein